MSTGQDSSRAPALVRVLLCVLGFALSLSVVFPVAVQAQTAASCTPVRIMPLGDSITVGKGSGTGASNNDYMTGYRQPLYRQLTAAGYAVNFVGGEQTGRLATPSFDIEHEGHSGYSPSQIAYPNSTTGEGGITNWLKATPADIVLLHIGTNGLTNAVISTHVSRVETILTKIDQYNPQIPVVLARIINRRVDLSTPEERQKTTDFNLALQQMADRRIANGDKIVVVDMEKVLNYNNPGDMYDKLHPNENGYAKMANVWQSALQGLLTKCTTGKQALFVTYSTTLNTIDTKVKQRLEGMGYTVTLKDQTSAVTADANGKTLVLISSTVSSGSVKTKFRDVAVPVVTWEAGLYDDMGMTGTVSGIDYGVASSQSQVTITDASHPLAAGLSGTVQTTSKAVKMAWGVPNANAARVASLAADAGKATVFGYDTGVAMPGRAAPARRVGLFMENDTGSSLTTNGWKLFDAAVNWATGSGG